MAVYMDINIGDPEEYQRELAAWENGQEFFARYGQQCGYTGALEEMDSETQEVLQEAAAADRQVAAKGAIRFTKPVDIGAGRIVMQLDDSAAPKAAQNFRCLCTGERGLGKTSKKALSLRGCAFHRVVTGFCCQGGDIVFNDGSSGESIYGGKFNDEKGGLKGRHDAAGVLSMANSGKNSNTSQFFFTLAPAPQCDGKHVVFGRVTEGLDVLAMISALLSS